MVNGKLSYLQPTCNLAVAAAIRCVPFPALILSLAAPHARGQTREEFTEPFVPTEHFVALPGQPARQGLCLDGRWQFQPVDVPATFQPGSGQPPELPAPDPQRWEVTLIKNVRQPAGAALVETRRGEGKLWVSTLDAVRSTPARDKFWGQLFRNLGVKLTKAAENPAASPGDKAVHDLLLDGPPE